jgi:hypothetical protein
MLPVAGDVEIAQTQNALQQMQAAMLPLALTDFYKNTAGGMLLGDAHIFGLSETRRGGANIYFIPSILQVNRDVSASPGMRGRTIFGRNSLFWFAFDAFGNCFMLNNMTLAPMRQYEDAYKAMSDCLAMGKI